MLTDHEVPQRKGVSSNFQQGFGWEGVEGGETAKALSSPSPYTPHTHTIFLSSNKEHNDKARSPGWAPACAREH
jgi:hypothetical protein